MSDTVPRLQLELDELRAGERRVIEAITRCRADDVPWQQIADVLGHGDRAAAKRWYDRRTKRT